MKRLALAGFGALLVAMIVLSPLAAHAATTAPVSTQYQHIANTWNAPNSTYPDCSATVTTLCLSSYTYTATPPANTGGPSVATVPNGGIGAGAQVSYTWGPGGFLYCGAWTLSVVANYVDSTGASVSSSADTANVTVQCPLAPSPATGLSGTLGP